MKTKMDLWYVNEGKLLAPEEEQRWRDSQKLAVLLASNAVVQKSLAKEAQDEADAKAIEARDALNMAEKKAEGAQITQKMADTQAIRARDAVETSDEAGRNERRLRQAFIDAVNRKKILSSR